ncbi:MAG TPA: enoyl-CoA hydratase [Acidimicrobiia bacterium]|nr:enoyl-CoA hydratase [Acidimicrobiia bacterium]
MSSVLLEQDGEVSRITLDRPERRNALSLEALGELDRALTAVPESSRVIVLGGAGPAFSAGHDLGEMIDRPVDFYARLFDACVRVMERIHRVPQPVIARVHGPATAAGCQLVAACDLAVASEDATFATPGVKIGLFCSTPMVPISRAVGRKRAMEMLLTGEPIDAHTAAEWGLINRVVPGASLDAEIDRLVDQITRYSGRVIGIGKEAFHAQVELDEHRAYDLTKAVMTANARLADAQEGMGAFLEKRAPEWPEQHDA